MNQNIIIKILTNIITVLLFLYFIPLVGIVLLLLRIFTFKEKAYSSLIITIVLGLIILIPLGIGLLNIEIIYLKDILDNEFYTKNLVDYAKYLLTSGIIILVIFTVLQTIFAKLGETLKNYLINLEKQNREISEKNDLVIKEKREAAKNTTYVKCSYCGSDNLISKKFQKCKYCRRELVNKTYK